MLFSISCLARCMHAYNIWVCTRRIQCACSFVQLNIHQFKCLARFGLMHIVATNICVWIRTIFKARRVAKTCQRPLQKFCRCKGKRNKYWISAIMFLILKGLGGPIKKYIYPGLTKNLYCICFWAFNLVLWWAIVFAIFPQLSWKHVGEIIYFESFL